jgi:hypothetical protein
MRFGFVLTIRVAAITSYSLIRTWTALRPA